MISQQYGIAWYSIQTATFIQTALLFTKEDFKKEVL